MAITEPDDQNSVASSAAEGVTGKVIIWDLPVRIFHWALALAGSVGLYSGFENKFDLVEPLLFIGKIEWGTVHRYCGYSVIVLCLFRLMWGIIGSSNARLWTFFSHPKTLFNYMKTLLRPAKRLAGHNPMGGYASVIMILGFLAQGMLGLYAMDDYFYGGPLAETVEYDVSSKATSLHKDWGNILIWFIAIHITTIIGYRILRKRDLISAMVSGRDTLSEGQTPPTLAPLWRAIGAGGLAVVALYWWIG